MLYLYNILLLFAFPFLLFRAGLDRRYREGFSERLGAIPGKLSDSLHGKRPIWYHAASVGEVLASIKLLEGIKERWPDKKIVVSTFTATGNRTAKERLNTDGVIFLPIDLPFAVKNTFNSIDPAILVVMETEIWPNLISEAGSRNVPVVLVNGRISDRSFGRYRCIRSLLVYLFDKVSLILTQSEMNRQRFIDLGASEEMVISTGNLKFDFTAKKGRLPFMEDWGGKKVFTAGSTHSGEDGIVLDIYRGLMEKHPDLRLLIAPRHLERMDEVEGLLKERGLEYERRSRIKDSARAPIILLDTLGELSLTYSYSDIVFIGGSLVPVGGHNILEPALCGKPVLFGPHMQNFREAEEILISGGGGIRVKDTYEFKTVVDNLLSDNDLRSETGCKARVAVMKNSGATDKTIELLAAFIQQ